MFFLIWRLSSFVQRGCGCPVQTLWIFEQRCQSWEPFQQGLSWGPKSKVLSRGNADGVEGESVSCPEPGLLRYFIRRFFADYFYLLWRYAHIYPLHSIFPIHFNSLSLLSCWGIYKLACLFFTLIWPTIKWYKVHHFTGATLSYLFHLYFPSSR